MKPVITTWNSISINNSTPFKSVIPQGQLATLSLNPVLVNRADDYPSLSSAVKQGSALVINVYVSAGQDINASRETLKQYFFSDNLSHRLIVQESSDSDAEYYRAGIPVRLTEQNGAPNSWFITIQTEYPYWQLVAPDVDSWDITASGQTFAVTNSGNLPVKPIFTITPTTTKTTGYKYQRYISILNNIQASYGAPMDITDGGLDTAALTTAKMRADGYDFRVWLNGSEADRWLYDMDTANTKCWSNIKLTPPLSATINSITNVATTLTFPETRTSFEFLTSLISASNTALKIENEIVIFNPSNIDTFNYQITGLTRAGKNTSAAAHSAGVTAYYVENDLFILYGDSDSDVTDLVTDDNFKPIFNLSSTNEAWAYTYFYNSNVSQPGSWKPEVKSSLSKLSYNFTDVNNAFVNPAETLGLAERASADFTTPHETAVISWLFTHPASITDVLFSGEKYYTGSWPGIVGLQYILPNTAWFTAEEISVPTVTEVWQTFDSVDVDLGGAYTAVRFVIDGTLSSVPNEMAAVQFNPVTVTFSAPNLPDITVGSEAGMNFFDFKLTNTTTGFWIKITTPCPVNSALTVDCTTKTAYLADGRKVPVRLSSNRDDWLSLAPGSNTLQWDDIGTVAVTVSISHDDRIL